MFTNIAIVAAGAFVVFRIRQAAIRRSVKRTIKDENARIVEAWRENDPEERHLTIRRTVKPDGLLTPHVRHEKTYRRDPSIWEVLLGP